MNRKSLRARIKELRERDAAIDRLITAVCAQQHTLNASGWDVGAENVLMSRAKAHKIEFNKIDNALRDVGGPVVALSHSARGIYSAPRSGGIVDSPEAFIRRCMMTGQPIAVSRQ